MKKLVALKILCLTNFLTCCSSLMNVTYDQHEYFKEVRTKVSDSIGINY